MTVVDVQETEEQAAARIRRVRARKALAAAPEVAYQLRWDSIPLDGHTERGLHIAHEHTPLLTKQTDNADRLYARLHAWVQYWAGQLQITMPVTYGWRNLQDSHQSLGMKDAPLVGINADATPETAHNVVTTVASWLLWHELEIRQLLNVEQERYEQDVSDLVWDLRATAGLIEQRKRPDEKRAEIWEMSTRPCPECHKPLVRVEFFGQPMAAAVLRHERLSPVPVGEESDAEAINEFAEAIAGITVRCIGCRWAPVLRPSKIARWLTPEAINPAGPAHTGEHVSLKRPTDRNFQESTG